MSPASANQAGTQTQSTSGVVVSSAPSSSTENAGSVPAVPPASTKVPPETEVKAKKKKKSKAKFTARRKKQERSTNEPQCVGYYVDALDANMVWAEAKIIACDIANQKLRVHFIGWKDKWDIWTDTMCIAAHGSIAPMRNGKKEKSWNGDLSLFSEILEPVDPALPPHRETSRAVKKKPIARVALQQQRSTQDQHIPSKEMKNKTMQPSPRESRKTNIDNLPKEMTGEESNRTARVAASVSTSAGAACKPPMTRARPKKRERTEHTSTVTATSMLSSTSAVAAASVLSSTSTVAAASALSSTSSSQLAAKRSKSQPSKLHYTHGGEGVYDCEEIRAKHVAEWEDDQRFLEKCADIWNRQLKLLTAQQ